MLQAIKQFHINRWKDTVTWFRLVFSFYYIVFLAMILFGVAIGIITFAFDQF